jgi:hypothetical protein
MCHDEGTGLIGLGWVLEERKGVLLLFLFVMADVWRYLLDVNVDLWFVCFYFFFDLVVNE